MTLDEQVDQALEVLRRGGIILYPTDTVWGIGCDATMPKLLKRYTPSRRARIRKACWCC